MATRHMLTFLLAGLFAVEAAAGDGVKPRTDFLGDPLPARALIRIGTTRLRLLHTADALAVSADGRLLAAYAQTTIRVWNARDGKLLHELDLAFYGPWALAFSPDGKELAAASAPWSGGKGSFRRWRLDNGKVLQNDSDPQPAGDFYFGGTVVCVATAWRSDGTNVVAEGVGTEITLNHPGAAKKGKKLKGHAGRVMGVAFTRDGATLVSLGDDGTIRYWDVDKGTEVARAATPAKLEPGLKGNMAWIAVADDGKTLAFRPPDGSVRLLDRTGQELGRLRCEKSVEGMAFAPDGRSVFTASDLVRQWDVRTGVEIPLLTEAREPLRSLVLSPDGKLAAFADDHDRLRLAAVTTGKTVFDGVIPCAAGIAFSPDGKHLVTAADKTIAFWDVARLLAAKKALDDMRTTIACSGKVAAFALAPDGGRVAAVDDSGVLHVYAVASRREEFAAEAPNDELLKHVRVWPTARFVAFSPDSKKLVTVGAVPPWMLFRRGADQKMRPVTNQAIRLWDTATGKEIAVPVELGARAFTVAFHPGNKLLAAIHLPPAPAIRGFISGDAMTEVVPVEERMETIRLWDIAARRERFRFDDLEQRKMVAQSNVRIINRGSVQPVAFSPDGRLFAVPGVGGIVLFETATGNPRLRLGGHLSEATALQFTPDGRTLVSASSDGTVLIWDITGLRTGPKRAGNAEQLWAALGGAAEPAGQAMSALVDQPAEAVRVLRSRLKPVPADAPSVTRLIADLDDEDFATRDRAMQLLAVMGPAAVDAMTQKLRANPSLETARRIDQLLRARRTTPPAAAVLQAIRGIEVLEHIGTPDARDHLAALAGGGDGRWVTSEARAALARLKR